MSRNSPVRSYRWSLSRKSPYARCSAVSPPVTTLSSRRPCDWRWKVEAIWADRVGLIWPGRNATRNFSRSVTSVSMAQVSHASSHQVPVGVSAASKPSCSALRAICPRYFTDGGLMAPAAPVATP